MSQLRIGQQFRDEQGRKYKTIASGAIKGLQELKTGKIAWMGLACATISIPFAERIGRLLFDTKKFEAVRE